MNPPHYNELVRFFKTNTVPLFFRQYSFLCHPAAFAECLTRFVTCKDGKLWTKRGKYILNKERHHPQLCLLILLSHCSPLGDEEGPYHLPLAETVMILQQVAWWPTIEVDVKEFIDSCPVCQRRDPQNKELVDRCLASAKTLDSNFADLRTKLDDLLNNLHRFHPAMRQMTSKFIDIGQFCPQPAIRKRKKVKWPKAAGGLPVPELDCRLEFIVPTTMPGIPMHEGARKAIAEIEDKKSYDIQKILKKTLDMIKLGRDNVNPLWKNLVSWEKRYNKVVKKTDESPMQGKGAKARQEAKKAAAAAERNKNNNLNTELDNQDSPATPRGGKKGFKVAHNAYKNLRDFIDATTDVLDNGTESDWEEFTKPDLDLEAFLLRQAQLAGRQVDEEAVARRMLAAEQVAAQRRENAEANQPNRKRSYQKTSENTSTGTSGYAGVGNPGNTYGGNASNNNNVDPQQSSGKPQPRKATAPGAVKAASTGSLPNMSQYPGLEMDFNPTSPPPKTGRGYGHYAANIGAAAGSASIGSGSAGSGFNMNDVYVPPLLGGYYYPVSPAPCVNPALMMSMSTTRLGFNSMDQQQKFVNYCRAVSIMYYRSPLYTWIRHPEVMMLSGRVQGYTQLSEFIHVTLPSGELDKLPHRIRIPICGIDGEDDFGIYIIDSIHAANYTMDQYQMAVVRKHHETIEVLGQAAGGKDDKLHDRYVAELNKLKYSQAPPTPLSIAFDQILSRFFTSFTILNLCATGASSASFEDHTYMGQPIPLDVSYGDGIRLLQGASSRNLSVKKKDAEFEQEFVEVLYKLTMIRHRHALLMYVTLYPYKFEDDYHEKFNLFKLDSACRLFMVRPKKSKTCNRRARDVYVLYDVTTNYIVAHFVVDRGEGVTCDQLIEHIVNDNFPHEPEEANTKVRWRLLEMEAPISLELYHHVADVLLDKLEGELLVAHLKVGKSRSRFQFIDKFIDDYTRLGYNWESFIDLLICIYNETFTKFVPPDVIRKRYGIPHKAAGAEEKVGTGGAPQRSAADGAEADELSDTFKDLKLVSNSSASNPKSFKAADSGGSGGSHEVQNDSNLGASPTKKSLKHKANPAAISESFMALYLESKPYLTRVGPATSPAAAFDYYGNRDQVRVMFPFGTEALV